MNRDPRPAISFVDDAVRVAVRSSSRPGLVVESAPGRWMRIAASGETLAWARAARRLESVAWWRSERAPLEVVPPMRSEDRRTRSWPAFFLRALLASPCSPLTAGDWELAELVKPERGSLGDLVPPADHGPFRASGVFEALSAPASFALRWGSFTSRTVIALRAASPKDASRVKAWRKAAREGALPPALLFWVSGLDAYLILDGHDRLLAASLEGAPPSAVALYAFREEPPDPAWIRKATERHGRVFAHEAQISEATRQEANTALVRSHAPWRRHATPARATPGLAERFAREHPSLDGLPSEVRSIFEQR